MAAARKACDSGCPLLCASDAPSRRSSSSVIGPMATHFVSRGLPAVRVPVLSTTTVSARSINSSTSALRIRTPLLAPRPMPTVIDMGVASPKAQGHAMINTATAFVIADANRGSGPNASQATNVIAETATTAGTNTADTWSASFCTGARLICACATSRTICASSVSSPTCSAVIVNAPERLSVPPVTRSPGALIAGSESPVISDSSTELAPSATRPSTGTLSPGRTRNRSPCRTSSSGIS